MPNILGWGGTSVDLSAINTDWDVTPTRSIDASGYNIQAQVTITEDHTDELVITEHPVETGAMITDHAFKRPAEVRVAVGWTNAYLADVAGGGNGNVVQVYEDLQAVQNWRYPFTVFTGKRQYSNMLLQSLTTHTDEKLEFSFIANIVFREIILVDTKTIQTSVTGTGTQATPADPQAHTPSGTNGTVNTVPANVTPAQVEQAGGTGDF